MSGSSDSDVHLVHLCIAGVNISITVDTVANTVQLAVNGNTATTISISTTINTVTSSDSPVAPAVVVEDTPAAFAKANPPQLQPLRRVSEARLVRARAAGANARAVAPGEASRLGDTPPPAGGEDLPANHHYVVVASGSGDNTGVTNNLRFLRLVVGHPARPGAIYHGFASLSDCEAYWIAAGKSLPIPRLQ